MRESRDTYWTRLRNKYNLSIAYISRILDIPQSTLGQYFSGARYPEDETIKMIGTYFNLTMKETRRRFTEAYNQYHNPYTPIQNTTSFKREQSRKAQKTDTYWRKVVYKSEFTFTEVCQKVGVKNPTVLSNYLRGASVPNQTITEKICKLFAIDYEEGRKEFIEAHRIYNEDRNISNAPNIAEYNTFWGNLKAKAGYSNNYIASRVGTNYTTLAQYLKGDGIPKDEMIMNLCRLFDVDFLVGKQAFIDDYQKKHPNKTWHNRPDGLPPPPPNTKTRTYKNNFWSKERVKRGWSSAQIAEMLGLPKTDIPQVYNWFTGRNIPKEKYMKQLCKLFGVDFKFGKQMFIEAHQNWYSWKHDDKKICQYNEDGILYNREPPFIPELQELIYGKISVSLYNEVMAKARAKNFVGVLTALQPNIEKEDYDKLIKIIPEGNTYG